MILSPTRAQALRLSESLSASPANITRVGKATTLEDAAWAFQQWELRKKGLAKFHRASEMLFHREALEQATHEAVAKFHAAQFPEGALVADLTVGIGADLMALAERGPARGFELDPVRAECALWNVNLVDSPHEVTVEVRDSMTWLDEQTATEYAVADPARRVEGRRTLDLAEFQPDPFVLSAKLGQLKLGLIKLSPLLRDEDLTKLGKAVRFVSYRGECREALIYTGSDAPSGMSAVHVGSGEVLPSGEYLPVTSEPGRYIFDVDAAAVRAHALSTLATPAGLAGLGDSPGYLTGETVATSHWWKSYVLIETGSFDLKRLRSALKSLGSKTPVLKQRGTKLDLIAMEKQLAGGGENALTVMFFLVGKSVRYAIVEPIKIP